MGVTKFNILCFILSVKYIGGFTLLLLVVLAARDFWVLLEDRSKSEVSRILMSEYLKIRNVKQQI